MVPRRNVRLGLVLAVSQKLRLLPIFLLSKLHSVDYAPWIAILVFSYKAFGFFLTKNLGKTKQIVACSVSVG